MQEFLKWFTGGTYYNYHKLFHCLDYDLVSITLVIILCVSVFSGYMVIAWRWFRAASQVPESTAKKGLNDLKWIFIVCGMCSYLGVLLETVWPAWRLYMIMLAVLNFVTWRYILRVDSLEGVYQYLKDRDTLVKEIEEKQAEIEKLKQAK